MPFSPGLSRSGYPGKRNTRQLRGPIGPRRGLVGIESLSLAGRRPLAETQRILVGARRPPADAQLTLIEAQLIRVEVQ
uniref:Uncharacterized protein n=1 Tax=Candidatus Kentrum sp. LPFa TaxID=2126335 RepID=A0A450W818_9GAMM|nr:MAG: hypothetical protein BECKLPF1236A_GA0070988_1008310 [Candidatus Kentron sp. LPFa]VFK29293.1 MAG: hypothetical protein BECKLPF1236C_GA0070990_1008410 [Candidatus Kentron sp. LPFa]